MMNTPTRLLDAITEIESKINYTFRNRSLLTLAFVHCSFVNENREVVQHNERLEFLGDSVLGLLVAEFLYNKKPEMPEGELSYLRSRLVEGSACMTYVQKLDLDMYLLLGKGERMHKGRGRESILADLFDAIIGAIFLDGGIEAARNFLFGNFSTEIEDFLEQPLRNSKALLQEYSQKKYQQPPIYQILEEMGPDHSKTFCIAVFINGKEFGRGSGVSKKEAQQAAAETALKYIDPSTSS